METIPESRKSVQNLGETIHSLLGFKGNLTSAWVKSVCNIVKNLSSEASSTSASTKARTLQTTNEHGDKDSDFTIEVQKIRDELSALTASANELNIQRRHVLNDFLDLKGNIRVFCRIRPIQIGENFGRLRPVVAPDSRNVILKVADNKSKSYTFDKVFHPDSSQDDVFSEIEPVIKSVLDGYNACIFAYGQTGTGKTYTMEGTPDSPGIVPRAIKALFEQAAESNHPFVITFSMMEIYLGNLRDLLVAQPIRPTDPMPPCLLIETDRKGGTEIENLVAVQVSDFNHALKLYRLGCRFRSTASTGSNMTSSRSHCMIRMSVTCFDSLERRQKTNKIWLVDLGGSERILKSKASGRRRDEGKAINLSLSALGDVINALEKRKRHIPYRNSKLTQVLKDSLGKDSKTLMLVHVSPKEEDLCETICSLNFATRAKSIHLGHEDSKEERDRKEAVMISLQQTMKNIEEDRQRVRRDIKKFNEKLETLTGVAPSTEKGAEASELSAEEILSNPRSKKKKAGDTSGASASKLPGFMRSTICSRRKSGTDLQIPEERDLAFARTRRPFSRRAESVNFPVKKYSEQSSERSVPRSTFLLGLNTKSNAGSITEYSQDISECDIKMVVSEEHRKSQVCSIPQRAQPSQVQKYKNMETGKDNSTKFSRIDSWLRLQKTEPDSSLPTRRSKRFPPIPIPVKKPKSKERNMNKKMSDAKDDPDMYVPQTILSERSADGEVDIGEVELSKAEEQVNKSMVMLKDLFAEKSEPSSSCPSVVLDDQSMIYTENDSMIDQSECDSLYPPSAASDSFSHYTDDNGDEMLTLMEGVRCETKFFNGFRMDQRLSQISGAEADGSTGIEGESFSSISISDMEFRRIESTRDMGIEDAQQENGNSLHQTSPKARHAGLAKPKSQRALFIDGGCDKDPSFDKQQGHLEEKASVQERSYIFQRKIQTLYFGALLGLGILELGFDDNFFCGLLL